MTLDNDQDTISLLNDAFDGVAYHRDLSDLTARRDATQARRRRNWKMFAGAAAAAALAATGGIAAASHRSQAALSFATDVRSAEQTAALHDGEVTFGEYKAAFDRFSSCMAAKGRPITDVTLNPLTDLYNFAYDGNDDCYNREFYAVDYSWQVSPQRPRDPKHPDISSAQVAAACAANDPSALPGVPSDLFSQLCDYTDAAALPSTTQP